MMDIVVLWVLIIIMLRTFYRVKPAAAFFNIPYLLWVSFATVLNIAIWWLNQ